MALDEGLGAPWADVLDRFEVSERPLAVVGVETARLLGAQLEAKARVALEAPAHLSAVAGVEVAQRPGNGELIRGAVVGREHREGAVVA